MQNKNQAQKRNQWYILNKLLPLHKLRMNVEKCNVNAFKIVCLEILKTV